MIERRRLDPLVPLSALLLLLAGCGGNGATPIEGAQVSRSAFEQRGLRWPLTVDTGAIGCTAQARWFEHDGARYGLNGFASEERGYRELEPIWAVDEEMMAQLRDAGAETDIVMRISVGDLSEEAGRLCD